MARRRPRRRSGDFDSRYVELREAQTFGQHDTEFGIEIEQCARCGGRLRVIASIEEPELIERILTHRRERGEEAASTAPLGARGPPPVSLL